MPSAESLLPAGEGSSSANSGRPKGIRKMNDAVYLLSEPEGRKPDIEIVFIHGLQFIDHSDAFWKTWTTATKDQDGKEVCWPMAWLAEDFPSARILSVSYDSSAIETPKTGRIDLFLAGETLVQSMVDLADVGQRGYPIVFVCHSLGGLVAKQVVLIAYTKFSKERKYVDFLNSIGGFHFYATPHSGSILASYGPRWRNEGRMMKSLVVINDDLGRLNTDFDRFASAKEWKFKVVAETYKTSLNGSTAKLVEETSARYKDKVLSVQADHFGVCKPKSKVSSSYRSLTNLLDDVIQQNVLRNSNVWELPSFLVGMEDRLEEVLCKLKVYSRVGLVGMGGIGKTTLSKYVYNQKRRHFDKCCFLEDVKSKDISVSQKKLITDLCGDWDERKSMDLQLNCAKEYIMREKVLLVVDDVGSEEKLKALLVDAFKDGHGSKVIVTTRQQDIMCQEEIIDLDFLNEDESLQLFSHYAFAELGIEERLQLDGVSRKIAKSCSGLPLSIEVIGEFLKKFNKPQFAYERMDQWERALKKLRKAESLDGSCDRDNKLWTSVNISYGSLDPHHQSMFVDFACLFSDPSFLTSWREENFMELKGRLGRIWDDVAGIHILISRSLIKWNAEKSFFVMHDQLRHFGQSIGNTNRVRCEGALSSYDYHSFKWYDLIIFFGCILTLHLYRLYICFSKFISKIINDKIKDILCYGGTLVIDVIDIGMFVNRHSYGPTKIFLIISFIGTLWVLHYLWWYTILLILGTIVTAYTITSLDLISYFDDLSDTWEESEALKLMQQNKNSETLKGLLFLWVPRKQLSRIQKRWKKRSREKECVESLRLLNIRGSHVRVVEYFLSFHLSDLTWLSLSETRITHRSIRLLGDSFSKLRVLEMVRCTKLKQIPECIGHLSDLRELDLSFCECLRSLPNSIGQLKRLQVLYLCGCSDLVELPSTIGDLCQLRTLNLRGCTALEHLPDSFGKLSCLQLLDISLGIHLQWGAQLLDTRLQQLQDGGCKIIHCGEMEKCGHCTWLQPWPDTRSRALFTDYIRKIIIWCVPNTMQFLQKLAIRLYRYVDRYFPQ